jgi:hypothetical protein
MNVFLGTAAMLSTIPLTLYVYKNNICSPIVDLGGNVIITPQSVQEIWILELRVWSIELGAWSLQLGAWNLELGAYGSVMEQKKVAIFIFFFTVVFGQFFITNFFKQKISAIHRKKKLVKDSKIIKFSREWSLGLARWDYVLQ